MLLDISRFRGETDHIDRSIDAAALAGRDDDFRLPNPAHLVADLRRDGRQFRLKGHVKAVLECDCSRCLEPFDAPVDTAFELLFLPASDTTGAAGSRDDEEVKEDDLGVSYYENETIDLGVVVREQFYLALPMKPICQDDCRGLCPLCGVNRNRETCTCKTAWVDPRMDQLRKLL